MPISPDFPDAPPLPQPVTAAGSAGLAALIAEPSRAVVALDFDGTLAPIVDDPAASRLAEGAAAAMATLSRVVGCLAIVTGRPAGVAVELAALTELPVGNLAVLGHYGFERWDAQTGKVSHPPVPPGVDVVRQQLAGLLDRAGAPDGTAVEDKGASLAVHVRRTADPAAALASLHEPLDDLARRAGLVLEPGRMVLELRPPGMDKGTALAELVRARDARSVLFAGDDLGDLPAFGAVAALREHGVPGLAVCSGSEEVTALRERADLVVDGPAGVVHLLRALSAAIGSGG